MLTLRPPNPIDLPSIASLLETHWQTFSNDTARFHLNRVEDLLQQEDTYVIDKLNYAVGLVCYAGREEDLHQTMFLLIDPMFLKEALKQRLFNDLLQLAFQQVDKVWFDLMDTQRSLIRFLKRNGFVVGGDRYNHTRHKGAKVNVVLLECRKSKWMRKQNKTEN